uniref:Peptidase S54 rhomboid domain-containing protein n=1 Tax=Trichuris muris TaxID=70415 RepID=A0A5S6QGZ8_TRIMR
MTKRLVNWLSQARSSLSPFHCVTFVALSLGYLFSYHRAIMTELTVVPFYMLRHGHIWSLLTFWMIECNFCAVILGMALLHITYRVLEPIWGPKGVYAYFVLVNVAVGFLTCLLLSVAYAFVRVEQWMFFTSGSSIRGLSGFNGAAIYTLAHTFPLTILYKGRHFQLQVRHLPALVGFVYLLLCPVSLLLWGKEQRIQEHYFLMYATGLTVVWCYFRWCENRTSAFSNAKGESRSLLSSWLGSLLRPNGEAQFEELLDVKVHKITTPIDGVGALDAERYRQKAIKDLSERLAKTRATAKAASVQEASVAVEKAAPTPKRSELPGDESLPKKDKPEQDNSLLVI